MNAFREKCLKLLQVQTFFRHGARTPLHHVRATTCNDSFWTPDYATDVPETVFPFRLVDICSHERLEYPEVDIGPSVFKLPGGLYTGQLIKHGQEECFALGRRLKALYVDQQPFISRTLCPDELYCRSTLIRRTITSMRCVAAGIFGESFHENGKTEELPIHSVPLDQEYLFPNPSTCGILGHLFEEGLTESLSSPRHLEFKRKLRIILGVERLIDDLRPERMEPNLPIYFVRDDYISRQRVGFPRPDGLDLMFPEMDELSVQELFWELLGKQSCILKNFSYNISAGFGYFENTSRISETLSWPAALSLTMGRVFRMILCNMRNHKSLPRFHLYACHDSTIMLLLYGLGCFDGHWPPFAADLIIELYRLEDPPKLADFVRPCHPLQQNTSAIKPDGPNSMENETVEPEDLWFRVLYLGKPIPLSCLWKRPHVDNKLFEDGFVPLSALVERWTQTADNGSFSISDHYL